MTRILACIGAIFVGSLTVVQSRINGRLGEIVENGIFAAWISFGVGLLTLIVLVACFPSQRLAFRRLGTSLNVESDQRQLHRRAVGAIRPWHLLGGIGGATFVVAQSSTVQYLGVALFTVAVVASQNAGSLVVDRLGLGPRGVQAITLRRVLAAVLAVIGVVFAVSGQAQSHSFAIVAILFVLFAGFLIAAQQAINGRVAAAAQSPWIAGLMNFIVGFLALSLAFAVSFTVQKLASGEVLTLPPTPLSDPVLWLGGFIGVAFIVVAAVVVRIVGVLVFALLSITGQLGGAIVLDLLVPTGDVALSPGLFIGVAITAVAVVIATMRTPQTSTS